MTEDLYYLHERTCDSADPHEALDWYQRYAARLDGYAIAVEDYAAAVAAALAARGVTGVDYETAAGIDMVWIELTVPALRAGGAGKSVQDATVCFTDLCRPRDYAEEAVPGSPFFYDDGFLVVEAPLGSA